MDLEKKALAVGKKFVFDPSNFAHVVYLAVFALVAVLLAAAIIIGWRAKAAQKAPYSKHPTAQLRMEPRSRLVA